MSPSHGGPAEPDAGRGGVRETEVPPLIDFRRVDPERHLELLLEAFDRLPLAGALTLNSPVSLRPLYEAFLPRRGSVAAWRPLEARVAPHRAQVRRLRDKAGVENVEEFFCRDHDEIDAILAYLRLELLEAVGRAASADPAALRLHDAFQSRLDLHIRWEEEVLFPEVEEVQPHLIPGLGCRLRNEHLRIRDMKARLARQISAGMESAKAAKEALDLVGMLLMILVPHNQGEQSLYYPLAGYVLSQEADARVMAVVRSTWMSHRPVS